MAYKVGWEVGVPVEMRAIFVVMDTFENEEWRDVPGYEGFYMVSNLGRIKSIRNYHRNDGDKILSPWNKDGYPVVSLSKDNRVRKVLVRRLVAMAFLYNPDGLKEVDHINGIRSDCKADNLRWCTHKQNNNYVLHKAILRAANPWRDCESSCHPRAKEIEQLTKSGSVVRRWGCAKDAAIALGLSRSLISQCCTGKRNSGGGYRWRFAINQ